MEITAVSDTTTSIQSTDRRFIVNCLRVVLGMLLVTTVFFGQVERRTAKHTCAPMPGFVDTKTFRNVMETVAEGWNRGNSQLASSCFTENAVFSGPPEAVHLGRQALFEWFGGVKGRELPMHMNWHHLLFDPAQQIGVGEFTFRYRIQTHGLVIVKFSNGLIANWREYEVESPLPWDSFVGENRF